MARQTARVKRVHPPRSLVNTYSAASSCSRRHDQRSKLWTSKRMRRRRAILSPRDVHHGGFEINLVPAECVQSRKPLARADTDALLIMMVAWRAGGIFTHFAEKDVWDGGIT